MRLIITIGLTFVVLAAAAGGGAGCKTLGQAQLHEPKPATPALAGTQRDVPPPMTLETITAMGGSAPIRFETPAYAALQQNSFTEIGTDMDPSVCPDGQWIAFSSTQIGRAHV